MEAIKNMLIFIIIAMIGVCVVIGFIFGYMAGRLKIPEATKEQAKAEDDLEVKKFMKYNIYNN